MKTEPSTDPAPEPPTDDVSGVAAAATCSALVDLRDWKKFRISRGLTQKAASEAIGFSRCYIAQVETGSANAGWEFAAAIVETFGVSVKFGKFIISPNT